MIEGQFFRVAKSIAGYFYGRDDADGFAAFAGDVTNRTRRAQGIDDDGLAFAEQLWSVVQDPWAPGNGALLERWCFRGRWGALACPVVRVESAWAASVCCSRIPKDICEQLVPPWPAFVVDIPIELGLVWGFGATSRPIVAVQVHVVTLANREKSWRISLCASGDIETGVSLHVKSSDLFCLDVPTEAAEPRHGKSLRMALSIVGAVCMAFDSGDRRHCETKPRARREGRGARYPTKHEWIVGRPVAIDLTERVSTHVAGHGPARKSLAVQGVVCGHWKMQPVGPGRNQRRFIHIEPYWRGPEDAPILVRPHVLTE